ncbi:MAG: Rieske 2Fe-2S domain-containing protein [Chloroflexota bacterium]|nr:Rieske 2Fe-2S domain-containing protein [Chloroflexota bacterium]
MRSANRPLPSPFPEGWYFVASRKAVQRAGLLQKTWMGESIVAWCDQEGNVCVAEAVCPHLGSDLGPETGGRVCDGRLVCPFHGFEYDTTGQCVATPFAVPPRNARLGVFETRDIAGLIFAWWGIEGREPQWELPRQEPDQAGWTGLEINTLRFPGHPQETTENSVDLAHLRYVHGYDSVARVGSVSVDGPLLVSDFDFKTRRTVGKFIPVTMDISASTRIFGLGYSYVEIREHSIGMNMRLWVMATPVDGTLIDMSLASQVEEIRQTRRRASALGLLPVRMRAPLVNKFVAAMQRHDVLQDVVIWRRKQYRSRPRLCRSDGEIMPFRAYCAQFYPSPVEAVDEAPAAEEISTV